jgi:hypothetical protein
LRDTCVQFFVDVWLESEDVLFVTSWLNSSGTSGDCDSQSNFASLVYY